ncbi:gliding motility-associated protein GldE [Bacteroidales bacterium OttesenSCG-928-I14]|nr:gliding motility-associated protein GldE [Bacteroidales bacterium OttesenSCG-928-I14]
MTLGLTIVIVSILILFILSAIVSVSETAFFSLSNTEKSDIEKKKFSVDSIVERLLNNTDKLSVSIQIWDTGINIALVILLSYAFNHLFDFNIPQVWRTVIYIIIITSLILLIGEILPKIYAQHNSLKHARKTARLLYVLNILSSPLASLIVKTINSITNAKKKSAEESMDELSKALEMTSGEMPEEKEMLEGIIDLHKKTAIEIMTCRIDLAAIDISTKFKDVIDYVIEVSYSRIPVFEDNLDNIKGVLYIKDLLPYLEKKDNFRWQKLVRSAFFVPETKKIDDLLEEFRANKIHLAIVVDEYGGTSGVVTMEDILEEIVGEISDEYDDEENKYVQESDGSYVFEGKTLLIDFYRATDIDSEIFGTLTDEVDTLAGLVLELKGDFPEQGETIEFANYSFQVLEMDSTRILKIKIKSICEPEEE